MVKIVWTSKFKGVISKIKDDSLKNKIKKQINKIIRNPSIGKPMRFARKGTRELYIKPYRMSYEYFPDKNMIYLLDLYHKKFQ